MKPEDLLQEALKLIRKILTEGNWSFEDERIWAKRLGLHMGNNGGWVDDEPIGE